MLLTPPAISRFGVGNLGQPKVSIKEPKHAGNDVCADESVYVVGQLFKFHAHSIRKNEICLKTFAGVRRPYP